MVVLLVTLRTYAHSSDPRTEHLPMSRSPLPVLAIVGAYLYFSLSYGPRFMKNRQPFKLERVMLVYNAVQVVWCAYLVEESQDAGEPSVCPSLLPLPPPQDRGPAGYDPRTEHLPMARNPLPVFAIVGAYLYFSLSYGPRFMKNRQPFKLKRVMLVYNAVQCLRVGWGGTYNWICEPVNTAKTPRSSPSLLPIPPPQDRGPAGYGEHHTFLGFVNLIVHTIMYSYYFYSLLNPDAKSAQWKRYITLIQFVQFFLIGAHEIISLFHPDCDVIRPFTFGIIVQSAFMTALFKDFYHKAYGQGRNKKEKLNS
ncbi:hypothetical protein FOCC_FOCC005067 [Frankliniella occidentalis]|nr:hypothetical protein FOCC_FOCC005067 [Frankliniella occidentalis]